MVTADPGLYFTVYIPGPGTSSFLFPPIGYLLELPKPYYHPELLEAFELYIPGPGVISPRP